MFTNTLKNWILWAFVTIGLNACSSSDDTSETDVAEIDTKTTGITLPADHFGHEGAPVEWWWHTGTLVTEDGRAFGFEINASGLKGTNSPYAHSQIEITDTTNHKNYRNISVFIPQPENWCQYDAEGQWFVQLSKEGSSTIEMTAIANNPMEKQVKASFINKADGTSCSLDLEMIQEGNPLFIWGTGVHVDVDTTGNSPVERNHYYYALTKIATSGTLTIDEDTFEVSGQTWTDHQYGAFPKPFKWVHQNIQLNNATELSNYTNPGQELRKDVAMSSKTSILLEDGTTLFVDSKTTPMGPVFTLDNTDYFMRFKIEIDTPEVTSELMVSSLLGNQLMADPASGKNIYEGVASAEGTFNDQSVEGTAWVEENLE